MVVRRIKHPEVDKVLEDIRAAFDRLVDLVFSKDPIAQNSACSTLGGLGPIVAVPVAEGFWRAREPYHTMKLLGLLDAIGQPPEPLIFDALEELAFEDRDADVGALAGEILEEMQRRERRRRRKAAREGRDPFPYGSLFTEHCPREAMPDTGVWGDTPAPSS